jgi:RHS repeat-associated protein
MTSDTEIATLNQDQSLNSLFHSGVDGLISSTTTQGTSYYSYNPHSDAALITDENGNTKSQLHYDAWGNISEQTNEPFNYLGKYQRRTYSSPGLIKMGARFYDPNIGRFISRDPMKGQDEMPISYNPYIYAYDDPVNMKDLSGMSPIGDALRLVGMMYDMLGFHFIAAMYYMQAAVFDALEAGKTPPAQTPQTTRCFPFPLPRTIPFEPINTGHMEWSGELRYKYQSNHLVSNIGFRIRCQIDVEYIRSTTLGDLAGKILPDATGFGEWAVYDNRGEVFNRLIVGHKLPNWGFIFSGSDAGPFTMSWATYSIVTSVLRLGVTISWHSIWDLLVPIIVFPITEWFPYDVIEIPHFSDSY